MDSPAPPTQAAKGPAIAAPGPSPRPLPAAMPPMPPMPPPVTMRSVPWRTVYRWAWYVVGVAPVWVAIQTAMSLGVNILNQYNMQVLATATSALSAAVAGSTPAPTSAGGIV